MKGAASRADRGDTLIEVIAAVAILGIAGVALMTGMALSATVSGRDRGQSSSSTYVRDFAEQIERTVANGGYNPSGSYSWTPPSGTVAVDSAQCLTKASAMTTTPSWGSCPSPSDGYAELLKLKATAPNGSTEYLTILVRKPCTGASGDTC